MDASIVEPTFADESSTSTEWTFDPNEPRYCICNQISYGDMVACDNTDVCFVLSIYIVSFYFCFVLTIVFVLLFSVRLNGSITLVLASPSLPKESGIALGVYLR